MSHPELSLQQKPNPPTTEAAAASTTTTTTRTVNMSTDQSQSQPHPSQPAIDWESERQLLSSLAKLQELESKIHTLRTLLPTRLLAPLDPIVNDRPTPQTAKSQLPQTPQELNARLTRAAVNGVNEITEFRNLWQSPEMYAIWARLTQKMVEGKGAFPQPSGVWERDYAELLNQFDAEEEKKGRQNALGNGGAYGEGGAEKEADAAAAGKWEEVVDSFRQRQSPHFRLSTSKVSSSVLLVHLGLAGITLELEQQQQQQIGPAAATSTDIPTQHLPEWRVSTHTTHSSRPASRVEMGIVQQLNARDRKWDLRYLLEMIVAYADIRRAPCQKCNTMTDSQAQLPVVRRAVNYSTRLDDTNSTKDGGLSWEAYHVGCV